MFVNSSTGVLKKILVSKPSCLIKPAPINEISKKWTNEVLDQEKMAAEHAELVEAYQKNGVEVFFAEPDAKRPHAVFSRDFGACIQEGYILGRFKKEIRFDEHKAYKKRMEELGIPLIVELKEGYFEGGDFFFLAADTLAVGLADRTDEKGLSEIRQALSPLGYEVIGVPCKADYLHLDMCFNLVDTHLAVAYRNGLPKEFLKKLKELAISIIDVEEEAIFAHGCNVQSLGNKRVLSLKQNKEVNQQLRAKGMTVTELDIKEILKAGGGPHCMTFPLKRL